MVKSLVLCVALVIFISHAGSNIQTKVSLLKDRMHVLENRLSEDIFFLRKELYSEISSVKELYNASAISHIREIDGSDLAETDQAETIKQLGAEFNSKLNVLQEGMRMEKVYRRDLQRQMRMEQSKSTDVVRGLTKLEETVKIKMEELEISDMLTVLQDMKHLLEGILIHVDKDQEVRASDCSELLRKGQVTSGLYEIFPDTMWRPLKVYCDMTTDGGGWTVFQRRCDGSENFYRSWNDYRFGFGNLSSEFWMGNEFLYRVMQLSPRELRIELEDFENDRRYAKYGLFEIESANELFQIHVEDFSGNVTDSLSSTHDGRQFSTFDKGPSVSCSKQFKGGFWYNRCHGVNINGEYLNGEHESYANGVNWSGFRGQHYSLKFTEMKFRSK